MLVFLLNPEVTTTFFQFQTVTVEMASEREAADLLLTALASY